MSNHRVLPLVMCGLAVSAALLSRQLAGAEPIREPVRLIFDTDIGNDVDDAMALCMIHALASRGECQPLAVTITKDNPYAAPMVDLLNTFFGRPEIPIGMVRGGVTPQDGKYLRQVVTAEDNGQARYPHKLRNSSEAPEAVGLLRKILAGQPDGSVVLAQVGFSTNLARLLDSPADDGCPLAGRELVQRKVRLLSAMAGAFGDKMKGRKEYNIVTDVEAARRSCSPSGPRRSSPAAGRSAMRSSTRPAACRKTTATWPGIRWSRPTTTTAGCRTTSRPTI